MIEVNIPLFGLASLELPIAGQEVQEGDMFRIKGVELLERLHIAAAIVDLLVKDGWLIVGEVFHLCAFRADILTMSEAKERLRFLGIHPGLVSITESSEFSDE